MDENTIRSPVVGAAKVAIPAAPPGLSHQDQRAIYERYLPIVRRIAMRTVRTLPPSVTIDDVISAGWLGMVEALGRRTPEMTDDHFEAFASYRVRGAILDHLRMLDPMSRKLRGASRSITQVVSELVGRLGRTPEQEEVAGELGMSLEEYQKLLTEISEAGFARLDIGDFEEPLAQESSPESIASRRETVRGISKAIDALPERLQLVVGLYYQEDCSFREIGEVLGVTESRVCQLHSEAMHLIRATLEGGSAIRSLRPPPPPPPTGNPGGGF